ncbi:MAG: DUF296 domain-containing protein [Desulfuromonas sp.]|nr:MAG: DUF296 domain-containing protein [Desulfuromonas sp.]
MQGGWCKELTEGRRFILKIMPGEEVARQLLLFVQQEGVKNAVIVSAIGSVKNVHFRGIKSGAKRPITEPRMRQHREEGPFELLGLEGNLIAGEQGEVDCHLHVILAKSSGEVIGGHFYDAEVFASCEILLTELLIEGVERHVSKSAGTPTIFINEESSRG